MPAGEKKSSAAETFRMIKHDVKNQLSNINLAIEQLKHDMQNAPQDQLDYLDMIAQTTAKIDSILNSAD